MKTFHTKIGIEFIAIIGLVIVGLVILSLQEEFTWGILIPVALLFLFLDWCFRTYYTVKSGILEIKCGFLKMRIELSKIRKVSSSRDLLSTPALSIDRLEILYNKYDTVLVSPKDKIGFIDALLEQNPDIEIKVKQYKPNLSDLCAEKQSNATQKNKPESTESPN